MRIPPPLAVLAILFVLPAPAIAQSQDSQWTPSASFLAGRFDTRAIAATVAELTEGHEVDLRGRSWDVGATRGRPGHSYFRLAFTQLNIDDGSRVSDGNSSYTTRGLTIKGFKAERHWRLGPSRWVVAPMLSLHGGAGKASGTVIKHGTREEWNPETRRYERVALPPEERPAEEMLHGMSWIPLFGAAVGVTSTLSDRVTITAGIVGLEFPGTYTGQIQVVYWLRRP